jgi:hypothetical protein
LRELERENLSLKDSHALNNSSFQMNSLPQRYATKSTNQKRNTEHDDIRLEIQQMKRDFQKRRQEIQNTERSTKSKKSHRSHNSSKSAQSSKSRSKSRSQKNLRPSSKGKKVRINLQ